MSRDRSTDHSKKDNKRSKRQRRATRNSCKPSPVIANIDAFAAGTEARKELVAKLVAEKQPRLITQRFSESPFRYACVCDVEATCEAKNNKNYGHEIIEFPVVLVDLEDHAIVDQFHTYVRPTVNAELSDFCKNLTGISQTMVDSAPTLEEALEKFDAWRKEKGLVWEQDGRQDFAFACDGPYDMKFFLGGECRRKNIDKPSYYDRWVNVKTLFTNQYTVAHGNINHMLAHLGMEFEGRPHSGIDDTRNIARIVVQMRKDGAEFYRNEGVYR